MRKYSDNTLYFFPAFLPLAELVPWLLTLLGAVAGAAGFSHSSFWSKYRKLIIGCSIMFFGLALAVILYVMPAGEVRDKGSRAIATGDFYTPQIYQNIDLNKVAPIALADNFGKLWTINVQKRIISTPVVSGALLIYGSYEGSVEALSINDGQPVWSVPQRSTILTLNQDANGMVYAGEGTHDTQSALFTAIDPVKAKTIWSREFLGHIEEDASFDLAHNRLWTGSGPGGLWAVDSRDGKVLWHKKIGHVDSKPLYFADRLYVPADIDEKTHSTSLFALEADSGKVLWQLPQTGQPWGSPIIDKSGERILTTTGMGQIGVRKSTDAGWAYAVSPNGKIIWQEKLASMPLQPCAYLPENDLVIHTLKNGEIVALKVADGSVVWHKKIGEDFQTAGTIINGFGAPMLASTTFDGKFTILNALTGEQLTEQRVGTYVISSPVVLGDVVYVASANSITAFNGLHKLIGKK